MKILKKKKKSWKLYLEEIEATFTTVLRNV